MTMTVEEREAALERMRQASNAFYFSAIQIGCHPWIEFTGLLNEYIKMAHEAHAKGIDFTDCSTHSGVALPMPRHSRDYINDKLECIFVGAIALREKEAGD